MDKKFFFSLGLAMMAAIQAFGATYYVAVDGNDNDKGSKEKPFASLNKANAVVKAGDTVWVRGGVYDLNDTVYYKRYEMTAGILLTASGESDDKRIYYFAYPGERPIFDGTNLPIGQACRNKGTIDSVMTTSPIVVAAKYLHLKGFEVRNTPMKCNSNSGIFLYASKHIILEQIDSHHNAGPGIFIHDGASGGGGHLVLNCDAHDNYDPTGWQGDGENADGFGVHYQHDGDTTRFVGCRSWWNSDDGYDVLAQEFPVIVENSYAMGNGYIKYGTATPPGVNGHVIPGHTIFNDMMAGTCTTVTHLEAVAIYSRRRCGSILDITIAHSIAVFYNDREFLRKNVIAVVAVPPGTASHKSCSIAIVLIMHAKAVGIFAIALPTCGVVIVVGVAVQHKMATTSRGSVMNKNSWARIMMAVDLLQNNMLTCVKKNSGIGVALHGGITDFETFQMQVLCCNNDRRSRHDAINSPLILAGLPDEEICPVKNRAFPRVRKIINARVVAFAAGGQKNARRHLVALVVNRIVQVVDSPTNPDRIARLHNVVRLVEGSERLFLGTDGTIVTVNSHIIGCAKGLGRQQG